MRQQSDLSVPERPLRVVFMGSADVSCRCIEALAATTARPALDLVGVVTQPDRPSGRQRVPTACPARLTASATGTPVRTPENVNSPQTLAWLTEWRPDVIAVAAYGQILKPDVLALPPLGCVNLHTSLLPRYRGAAPIQWAIARGERETGNTTMYMNERMDAGDIILQDRETIRADDTAQTLRERLAESGSALLVETLRLIGRGDAPRRAQNEAEATYAPKLDKEDGALDWRLSAHELDHRIRAFYPWPGGYTRTAAGRLKILQAVAEPGAGPPGTTLSVASDGIRVGTGRGVLRIVSVQPEGKRPMPAADYARGHGDTLVFTRSSP
jgi:methionyl-tRNA formyltransferase